MGSTPPFLAKVAAALVGVIGLRVAVAAGFMVWRFGAVGDGIFLLGVAVCLVLVAHGLLRGRMHTLALAVAVLATAAARLMLDAVPIIKYRLLEPVRWIPLGMAVVVGLTALLLVIMPRVRSWLTAPPA
jgi:hypothetical protein